MGLMDKFKFWKKEEPEFQPEEFKPPEMPSAPEQPSPPSMEQFGMPRPVPGVTEPPEEHVPPAFAQPPSMPQAFGQQAAMSSDQQLQLINSKLDTIKAQLETVLQRLERFEKKEDLSPYQQRWRNI